MQILPPLHSADDMQAISNLAHQVEGAVLGLVALTAIAEPWLMRMRASARFAWPVVLVFAGVFLFGYLIIPHHGLDHTMDQWRFVFGDAQQRQHVLLSLLILAGAGAEIHARKINQSTRWSYVWPSAVLIAGILFLTHPQHGTTQAVEAATRIHRLLGLSLIVTAALRTWTLISPSERRVRGSLWAAALLSASLLLFAYREPPGSYQDPSHEMTH